MSRRQSSARHRTRVKHTISKPCDRQRDFTIAALLDQQMPFSPGLEHAASLASWFDLTKLGIGKHITLKMDVVARAKRCVLASEFNEMCRS